MSDFFSEESVFKKPALPSRYRRTPFNNQSAYTSSKLKEKIEVLEKFFPQNDYIWETLIHDVDNLCFVKLSEQVLQPTSQQSLYNGASTCPSTHLQNIESNEKVRNNYTQSTNLTRDYVQSQSSHVCRSQNAFSAPMLQESSKPEYRRCQSQNMFPAPVHQESHQPEYHRSRLEDHTSTTFQGLRKAEPRLLNMQPEFSHSSGHDERKEPQVVQKLNTKKISSRQRTASKENDSTRASGRNELNSSRLCVSVPSIADRLARNDQSTLKINAKRTKASKENDSTRASERSELNSSRLLVSVPSIAERLSKNSQSLLKITSKKNQSAESAVSERFAKTKINESVITDAPNSSGSSAVSNRPLKQKQNELPPKKKVRDLSVLNSDDENDSLAAFFQKKRKLIAKKASAVVATSNSCAVSSVVPSRITPEKRPTTRVPKRQISEVLEEESISGTESDDSPVEVTEIEKKPAKKTKKAKSVPQKRVVKSTNNNKKKAKVSQVKPATRPKNKNSQKPKASPGSSYDEKDVISSSDNASAQAVDGSFFGEVSSILENGEVSLLRVDRRRGRGSRSGDTDASMPFFSPFAGGASRSTSGFSAVSTPLSKTAVKNVIGKRLKKPSVVAELKDELKQNRKRRTQKTKPNVIQPVHEVTARTESDCEVSDFSDMD